MLWANCVSYFRIPSSTLLLKWHYITLCGCIYGSVKSIDPCLPVFDAGPNKLSFINATPAVPPRGASEVFDFTSIPTATVATGNQPHFVGCCGRSQWLLQLPISNGFYRIAFRSSLGRLSKSLGTIIFRVIMVQLHLYGIVYCHRQCFLI